MFIIIPQWDLIGGVRMSRKTFIFGGYISDSLSCCCHNKSQQFVHYDLHQNVAHYQPILMTEPLPSRVMWWFILSDLLFWEFTEPCGVWFGGRMR